MVNFRAFIRLNDRSSIWYLAIAHSFLNFAHTSTVIQIIVIVACMMYGTPLYANASSDDDVRPTQDLLRHEKSVLLNFSHHGKRFFFPTFLACYYSPVDKIKL